MREAVARNPCHESTAKCRSNNWTLRPRAGDVLEWAEKAALENIRYQLQSTDTLAKEANTTLTILIAALGAAFAYAITGGRYAAAATVLTGYLAAACIVLVTKCMMIDEAPAPTNEPRNLVQVGYTLEAMRRAELRNAQERIDRVVQRNDRTALWLNGVRVAAVCAPVVFAVTAFVASALYRVG